MNHAASSPPRLPLVGSEPVRNELTRGFIAEQEPDLCGAGRALRAWDFTKEVRIDQDVGATQRRGCGRSGGEGIAQMSAMGQGGGLD